MRLPTLWHVPHHYLVKQLAAVDQLHDQVHLLRLVIDLVECDDVGVRDTRQEIDFALAPQGKRLRNSHCPLNLTGTGTGARSRTLMSSMSSTLALSMIFMATCSGMSTSEEGCNLVALFTMAKFPLPRVSNRS